MASRLRIVVGVLLGLASPLYAQDQIPLVCHDEGIQIRTLPGTNVANATYGLTQSFVNNVLGKIPNSDTMSLNYNRFHNVSLASQFFVGEVDEGTGALQAALHNYTTACPNTPIVIHGYSEGGCVVMNVLCGAVAPFHTPTTALASSYASNIIAVILYGQETRVAGQSFDLGTCDSNAPHLARSNSGSCAAFAAVIQDFCFADDSDCCITANASNPNATNGQPWHYNYPNYFDDVAANFIVSQHDKFIKNSTTTAELPTGVTTVGCFIDSSDRILPEFMWSANNNTAAACSLACRAAGYQYSGTESSRECYCGSSAPPNSLMIDGCWEPCTGDPVQECGNNWRINVYFDSLAVPISAQLPAGLVPLGCFTDNSNRVLPVSLYNNASNTQTMCALGCRAAGYVYSGTENTDECWCGDIAPTVAAPNSTCNVPCPAQAYQTCGGVSGSWAINVLKDTTVTTTAPTLPAGVVAQGCYQDSWTRTLPYQAYNNASNTNALCAKACIADGYIYSGTENYQECWCGDTLPASLAVSDSSCTEICAGSPNDICGGSFLLSVSKYTYTTAIPTGWSFLGCYSDWFSRTFPTQLWAASNNSDTACLGACQKAGYTYAGTENGDECWCGSAAPGSTLEPITGCNMTCAADVTQVCGASWRLSTYAYAA